MIPKDPTPPRNPLTDLSEACFRLLGTLQNIEKEEQPDPEDFQTSMHKMSAAMRKFIQ